MLSARERTRVQLHIVSCPVPRMPELAGLHMYAVYSNVPLSITRQSTCYVMTVLDIEGDTNKSFYAFTIYEIIEK